jgi:hypothetical protein
MTICITLFIWKLARQKSSLMFSLKVSIPQVRLFLIITLFPPNIIIFMVVFSPPRL